MNITKLKTVSLLVILLILMAPSVFSNSTKVRVISSSASIMLKPSPKSTEISQVPLGVVLDVIKKEGDWFYIKLPPNEKGLVVTGYIHQNNVEVIKEIKPFQKQDTKIESQKFREINNKYIDKEQSADYLKWKKNYDKAVASLKKWTKYARIGLFGGLGLGVITPLVGGLVFKENYLVPTMVGLGASLGLCSFGLYALIKRNSSKERVELLMNEGQIKKYFSAYFDYKAKYFVFSLKITF